MTQPAAPSRRRAFVFAGGGTGGHIYPALAIIEQLKILAPDSSFHILCSNRPIDTKILADEGIPFSPIAAMPVSKNPRGLVRFITSWGPSVRQTRACIRALKQSDDSPNQSVVLVAMGGFVAAPAARAAHAEKIPVALVNLDAVPGKANLLIAKKAAQIWSGSQIEGHRHWQRVAPIVRASAINTMSPQDARKSFNLDPHTNTLLITGGSQGASSITNFVIAMLDQHTEPFAGWQVIHQAGTKITNSELGDLRKSYELANVRAWVEPYIDQMGDALAAADLSLGRSGAGTVAECWAVKLPSIFMPYPYHQDEHQRHNAKVLIDAGSALILTDHIDPAINIKEHADRFAGLLSDPDRRDAMLGGYESLPAPDGAATIARSLLEMG